jgi:hypothetical protein
MRFQVFAVAKLWLVIFLRHCRVPCVVITFSEELTASISSSELKMDTAGKFNLYVGYFTTPSVGTLYAYMRDKSERIWKEAITK